MYVLVIGMYIKLSIFILYSNNACGKNLSILMRNERIINAS